MKICVFCSSAKNLAPKYQDAADQLGRLIGEHGHELVFGGYETGTMGNVARMAKAAGARVVGVIPAKAGELPGRPAFPCDELVEIAGLGPRKMRMAEISDAFVALPGAFGTLDELYDVLALQKMMGGQKPIALVNVDGFWDPLAQLDARMVADGFMSESCAQLYASLPTPEEVMRYLEEHAR